MRVPQPIAINATVPWEKNYRAFWGSKLTSFLKIVHSEDKCCIVHVHLHTAQTHPPIPHSHIHLVQVGCALIIATFLRLMLQKFCSKSIKIVVILKTQIWSKFLELHCCKVWSCLQNEANCYSHKKLAVFSFSLFFVLLCFTFEHVKPGLWLFSVVDMFEWKASFILCQINNAYYTSK